MVLTNDKIRLHVEYAVRCLFHFPTNAQQRVHFRSSIFNLSGHRRMMNVNESAHVFALVPPAMANKVALAFFFGFKRSCCPASSSENHSLKPSCMTVCALPHTGTQCCVCPHAFVVYALCVCACARSGEVLVRTRGRGQRERSLIKTDRSNTLAVPWMTALLEAAGPSARIPL